MALYNFSGNDLTEDFTRYEQRNDISAVHPQFSSEPIWNIISDPDDKINGSICVRKLYPQIQTRFRIHKRFMRKFYPCEQKPSVTVNVLVYSITDQHKRM